MGECSVIGGTVGSFRSVRRTYPERFIWEERDSANRGGSFAPTHPHRTRFEKVVPGEHSHGKNGNNRADTESHKIDAERVTTQTGMGHRRGSARWAAGRREHRDECHSRSKQAFFEVFHKHLFTAYFGFSCNLPRFLVEADLIPQRPYPPNGLRETFDPPITDR